MDAAGGRRVDGSNGQPWKIREKSGKDKKGRRVFMVFTPSFGQTCFTEHQNMSTVHKTAVTAVTDLASRVNGFNKINVVSLTYDTVTDI